MRPTWGQTFWSKVEKTDTCWLWTASRDRKGYGRVKASGRAQGAHRVAYELLVGPIPGGLQLDHLCRNRACVNPSHLEPVTSRENTMRSPISPTAVNSRKTHCPQGHPYTGRNAGGRYCVICNRRRVRDWKASRRNVKRIAS